MHVSNSCRLPVGSAFVGALSYFSLAWLTYYAAQDTIRRSTIRSRRSKYPLRIREVGLLPHNAERRRKISVADVEEQSAISPSSTSQWHGKAPREEVESIKGRFAPLRILGRYVNPFPEWRETGVWEVVYWKLIHSMFQKPRRLAWEGGIAADLSTEQGTKKVETLLPVQALDRDALWGTDRDQPCAEANSMTYTWIGQSTTLIQMNGVNILTDPVFGLQPVESIFSPTRMRPMPCTIEELTKGKIDIVLISHNHFDHFQLDTLPHLSQASHWIVPTGMKSLLLANHIPEDRINELSWWESTDLKLELPARKGTSIDRVQRSVQITAAPSMHWTGRSLLDVNRSLWCSYVLRVGADKEEGDVKSRSFFFCCDSGYTPLTFSSIGRALGPVDAAAIPIGSYKPRWFMKIQHGSPHDALKIAADIGSKQNFATHWGTWCMSDERWDEPYHDLQTALQEEKVPKDYLVTLPFGKTVTID